MGIRSYLDLVVRYLSTPLLFAAILIFFILSASEHLQIPTNYLGMECSTYYTRLDLLEPAILFFPFYFYRPDESWLPNACLENNKEKKKKKKKISDGRGFLCLHIHKEAYLTGMVPSSRPPYWLRRLLKIYETLVRSLFSFWLRIPHTCGFFPSCDWRMYMLLPIKPHTDPNDLRQP